MRHEVGIHQVYRLQKRREQHFVAKCLSCDWTSYETSGSNAQRLAMEHNGGTLNVVERRPRSADRTMGTEEMFPGVA